MAITNHRQENANKTIYDMVLARLPFLEDSERNQQLLSLLTFEVMNELELCFKVTVLADGTIDETRLGDEQYYSVIMKSIIADIVSVYVLLLKGVGSRFDGSTETDTGAGARYMSKTKAGSVEVEWDQFDSKKMGATWLLGTQGLIDQYRQSAIRKARTLGCVIDICNDCSIALELMLNPAVAVPFLNIGSCGCC